MVKFRFLNKEDDVLNLMRERDYQDYLIQLSIAKGISGLEKEKQRLLNLPESKDRNDKLVRVLHAIDQEKIKETKKGKEQIKASIQVLCPIISH
ncbi:hypothetical protein J7J26_00295 [Candidatus Micrarchaeota archaeon]|nr:hypothetical protein [Candidatus Micrarchaeota archaeon]